MERWEGRENERVGKEGESKEGKRERLVEVGEGEDWEMWGKGGWMRGGERIKGKENEIQ